MKLGGHAVQVGADRRVEQLELVVELLDRLRGREGPGRRLEHLDQDGHDDHQHRDGHEHLDQRHAAAAAGWPRMVGWFVSRLGPPQGKRDESITYLPREDGLGDHVDDRGTNQGGVDCSRLAVPLMIASWPASVRSTYTTIERCADVAAVLLSTAGVPTFCNPVPEAALGRQVIPFGLVEWVLQPARLAGGAAEVAGYIACSRRTETA